MPTRPAAIELALTILVAATTGVRRAGAVIDRDGSLRPFDCNARGFVEALMWARWWGGVAAESDEEHA